MKYNPSPQIMQMYSHRSTGYHFRVRDPDTSSREQMELSSFRMRNNKPGSLAGSAQDSAASGAGKGSSPAGSEKGVPFDSKTSQDKDVKLGDQAKAAESKGGLAASSVR